MKKEQLLRVLTEHNYSKLRSSSEEKEQDRSIIEDDNKNKEIKTALKLLNPKFGFNNDEPTGVINSADENSFIYTIRTKSNFFSLNYIHRDVKPDKNSGVADDVADFIQIWTCGLCAQRFDDQKSAVEHVQSTTHTYLTNEEMQLQREEELVKKQEARRLYYEQRKTMLLEDRCIKLIERQLKRAEKILSDNLAKEKQRAKIRSRSDSLRKRRQDKLEESRRKKAQIRFEKLEKTRSERRARVRERFKIARSKETPEARLVRLAKMKGYKKRRRESMSEEERCFERAKVKQARERRWEAMTKEERNEHVERRRIRLRKKLEKRRSERRKTWAKVSARREASEEDRLLRRSKRKEWEIKRREKETEEQRSSRIAMRRQRGSVGLRRKYTEEVRLMLSKHWQLYKVRRSARTEAERIRSLRRAVDAEFAKDLLEKRDGPSSTQINSKPQKLCLVCGDKAKTFHYGALSCGSCGSFFQRHVRLGNYKVFKCVRKNVCEVNISSRKLCRFCRFEKCLKIGMNVDWVMTDDERNQLQPRWPHRRCTISAKVIPIPEWCMPVSRSGSSDTSSGQLIKLEAKSENEMLPNGGKSSQTDVPTSGLFKCSLCDESFNHELVLQLHQELQHQTEKQCQHCDKKFKDVATLSKHKTESHAHLVEIYETILLE